jgi:hypothetical protein
MTDDVQLPTTETVANAAQVVTNTESTTEEAFDKERALRTIHAQREEMKEAKAQLKELAQLKAEKQQKLDAELSETERLKKQAEEVQQENARLKSDILKRDVVAETGLPAIFADRLKGDTKEAMLADALEIMKALPQQKVNPKVSATNPANAELVETDAQKRARLFGTQQNAFNIDAIKQAGGGVVWNQKP